MAGKDLTLLGLSITNVTMDEALSLISSTHEGVHAMHFVNAHCINVAAKDEKYRHILQKADALFADGSGIRLAGKWLGCPIVDNVNGTDLFPLLCDRFAEQNKKMFLLGSAPEVAHKAGLWAEMRTGKPIIAGTAHGYFKPGSEEDALIAQINASGADVLLVALGVPRQEQWIEQMQDRLNVPLCMGVGALFDFYSGTVKRAPKWMRAIGMEWVWRLLLEPRRMWRRYVVGNIVFVIRLLRFKHKEQRKT